MKYIDARDTIREEEGQSKVISFEELGSYIGGIVAKKNKAYGDSVTSVEMALEALYPNGIKPEQYRDLGLLVRIWDKMMRIANQKEAFEENPYQDIAGYGLLGLRRSQK